MNLICRLCTFPKSLRELVDVHDPRHELKIILEKCCQLKIPDNDELPNLVCETCVDVLKKFWDFYNVVHKSHQYLLEANSTSAEFLDFTSITTSSLTPNILPTPIDDNHLDNYQFDNDGFHYGIKDIEPYTEQTEIEDPIGEVIDEEEFNATFNIELDEQMEEKLVSMILDSNPERIEMIDNLGDIELKNNEEQTCENVNAIDNRGDIELENNEEQICENENTIDNRGDIELENNEEQICENENTIDNRGDIELENNEEQTCENENTIDNRGDIELENNEEQTCENENLMDNRGDIELENNEEQSSENEIFEDFETIEYAENTDDSDTKSIDSKECNVAHNIESSTWKDYLWKCYYCKSNFTNPPDLIQHYCSCHDIQPITYVCIDCHKPYTKYNTFMNHVKAVHRPKLKLCCDVCNEIFSNYDLLANHRSNICNTSDYPTLILCTFCYKGFLNQNSNTNHANIHCSNKKRRKYQCYDCGKYFATKPNLKAHSKIHRGIKNFICDFCGKCFVQKANLDEHLVTHQEKSKYECDICQHKFKTPSRLTKHKTIHTGVKPHTCEDCGKKFRSKDTMRVHQRIHTGSYPYQCETCSKRFRFRSILVTHSYQHTGVRPYSCEECKHYFTNWPNYNKHMKRRHGIDTSSDKRKIYNAVAAAAAAREKAEAETAAAANAKVKSSKPDSEKILLNGRALLSTVTGDSNEVELYLVESGVDTTTINY